jgi:hypothetical protein
VLLERPQSLLDYSGDAPAFPWGELLCHDPEMNPSGPPLRHALATAVVAGALGALGAFAFVRAFSDNSLGATAATLNDVGHAVLGLVVGVVATTFIGSFLHPTQTAARSGALAACVGYSAIDGPLFILTADDAGAAAWLMLLGLPLVAAVGAFGAVLGFGVATTLRRSPGGSG